MRKTLADSENALKSTEQWQLQSPPERKQQQQQRVNEQNNNYNNNSADNKSDKKYFCCHKFIKIPHGNATGAKQTDTQSLNTNNICTLHEREF